MAEMTGLETMAEEDVSEDAPSFDELIDTSGREMEWLIAPEQFVDFWIAGIFLLVGTWQIITIMFLMLE